MGINCGNLVLLKAYAVSRAQAPPLGELLMFGRLTNTLSRGEQARVARRHHIAPELLADRQTEPLLRELGASNVRSLDISDHEGCDILFDLTEDITVRGDLARLIGGFDTILDFGTSEHVFNAPQALVNAWNLLREGGRYIFDLPVTGWASHGLYQFSPNYFHSVGRSSYFHLAHLFFHYKRGDRIRAIKKFDAAAYRWLNGRRKVSAWGVLEKQRPADMEGALSLERLRVMQADIRFTRPAESGRNRSYGISTIATGFARGS
jgi:SAM-dependent methyltransferase